MFKTHLKTYINHLNQPITDAPEYSGKTLYQANEGARDFRIQLVLDSNPIPRDENFSWFFNNQSLMSGVNGILLGVDFIIIRNVSRENAGSYRVLSSNPIGSNDFTLQLFVNCELWYITLTYYFIKL